MGTCVEGVYCGGVAKRAERVEFEVGSRRSRKPGEVSYSGFTREAIGREGEKLGKVREKFMGEECAETMEEVTGRRSWE